MFPWLFLYWVELRWCSSILCLSIFPLSRFLLRDHNRVKCLSWINWIDFLVEISTDQLSFPIILKIMDRLPSIALGIDSTLPAMKKNKGARMNLLINSPELIGSRANKQNANGQFLYTNAHMESLDGMVYHCIFQNLPFFYQSWHMILIKTSL